MTDNQEEELFSEGPEPSALVGSTDQPTPPPVASSPPPAYGRLGQTPNQQVVQPAQNEMQGVPMPITTYPEPPNSPPHSYLALAIVSVIICSVLNPPSMGLGIPAVVLSGLSYAAIQKNQWKQAERFGRISFYLTVINWIYVLFAALVTFGTLFGLIMAAANSGD